MSATNRGAVRNADDFYETPIWAVERLKEAFNFAPYTYFLEPCAGKGQIARAFPDKTWALNDINPEFARQMSSEFKTAEVSSFDFINEELWLTKTP